MNIFKHLKSNIPEHVIVAIGIPSSVASISFQIFTRCYEYNELAGYVAGFFLYSIYVVLKWYGQIDKGAKCFFGIIALLAFVIFPLFAFDAIQINKLPYETAVIVFGVLIALVGGIHFVRDSIPVVKKESDTDNEREDLPSTLKVVSLYAALIIFGIYVGFLSSKLKDKCEPSNTSVSDSK